MKIGSVRIPRAALVLAVTCALCATITAPLAASSVAPMPLAKMSEHTAQAFVGEVVSIESHWAQNPKRIETDVTFANVRYLKGRPAKASTTRTLTVPGGEVDGMQARICCSPRFEVGQKWVLLVLPEYRVYPVVGLHQGAFKVQKDEAGIERVYHASSRPITSVDKEGFALVENTRFDLETQRKLHANHSADHNVRINIAPHTEDKARFEAMPLTDFLNELQTALDASKSYRNAEQAGRRITEPMKAVPLRKANVAAEADGETAKARESGKLRGAGTVNQANTTRPQQQDEAKKEAE